ncbi:hypothetical protein CcaverHIS002_0501780 [Cutaneotrichosporon cavernicola]|uniref:Isochorismatase-like domain-containing protein n=1 Tax=Cutaneotrichosporon cavernicola TaxID=279322 RepID=A0AA48QWL6_9TREE|nr:uncharacterized protein CcaverHIS019_0502370 [Cutaneotrichosporon cavernicola]BEI84777.1 hypothetical protein CcaverHIS002_0501780 [Cutaneotrichosporon cavernicola]BEI92609.1 hypothetical protein CcaverHIS019_0502370 [Cutaneotrichosporon cavernicola]BEJ00384.1 hypothetical protein CcaverHIS631_0502410 [Cutaneotrichosporon cavernicola]BEJ08154.1 hypothetical protein CcaverHIS641_0502390 [Cutaneotrichosporon cavernicola]
MALSFRQLAGIPPSTASISDSVLLIVDAQGEYADGHLKVTNIATSRPALHKLYERYRDGGGDVVHIVHEVAEGTPVFTPGTALAAEFPELQPKSDKEPVVPKKFPGSFCQTQLSDVLAKMGKKKVVIVGYMAHVCVSTTAREASQHGYDVLIARDAIGDRDIPGATGQEVTDMVCHELGDAFGTIINSDEIQ